MAKTKAQMAALIKELELQRKQQYDEILRLHQIEDQRDKALLVADKRGDAIVMLEGELREKKNEITMSQRSFERINASLTKERDEHRDRSFKNFQRVQELEKLLVHNGKAIGALSDLAGEKYKNDDLPF